MCAKFPLIFYNRLICHSSWITLYMGMPFVVKRLKTNIIRSLKSFELNTHISYLQYLERLCITYKAILVVRRMTDKFLMKIHFSLNSFFYIRIVAFISRCNYFVILTNYLLIKCNFYLAIKTNKNVALYQKKYINVKILMWKTWHDKVCFLMWKLTETIENILRILVLRM